MSAPITVQPFLRHADEGEALWFLGSLVTIKAAGEDTRARLTVIEFLNPPGFAPPLHRHLHEDEMFYVLDGSAEFHCEGRALKAIPGDFVLLPVGLPHTFVVGTEAPFRTLQITTPAGFEGFAADVGEPASQRWLPDPGPIDPAALAHASALHGIEILGPPPLASH